MSLKQRFMGGLSPFAHLNGPLAQPAPAAGTPNAAATESSAEAGGEPEALPPQAAAAAAAKGTKKTKKTKKTEDDDDGGADDEDDEDEDGDDNSDEEEMRSAEDEEDDTDAKKARNAQHRAVRAARMRERARCATIFLDPAAANNPALAAQLAFQSNNSRSAALGILKSAGAGTGKKGLIERMASVPQPAINASTTDAGQSSIGERAIAAANKARGKVA